MESNFYSKGEISNANNHNLLVLMINSFKSENRLLKVAGTNNICKIAVAMKFYEFHERSLLYKLGHLQCH